MVAPAMVLDAGVWDNEQAMWNPNLDATYSTYHKLVKRERSETGGMRFTDHPADLLVQDWETVIFDEAHHLKGRKTHWTQAAEQIAKRADRVILSTGSPTPNWAHEQYTMLRILHPTECGPGKQYGSYWRWAGEWFPVGPQLDKHGNVLTSHHVTPRMKACPEDCPGELSGQCAHWKAYRAANLDGLVIARSWDDLGFSLPPLSGWLNDDGTPRLFKVKMTPNQRQVYQQLKKEFVAWTESGTQIEAWSQAGLQTKLRQVACGLEVADPTERGSGKLDVMQQLLDARRRPTVAVAVHHNTIDAIKVRVAELGMSCREVSGRTPGKQYRRDTIDRFQAGEIDVLIGQVDTIAEGLTLTRADNAIMVESSYRVDRNEQVIRKLWRLGQDRPVHIDRLTTAGTIDLSVMELLHTKRAHQLAAMPPGEYARLL